MPFRIPGSRFRGYRIKASRLAATLSWPGLDARNGLSLVCNGCGFHRLHSRVNAPGLLLRFRADRFRRPVRLRLRYRSAVCSATGRFNASDPLQLPRPTRSAASPASTPRQDCYVPPDQSVLPDLPQFNPPSDSARSPFAPRRRSPLLVTAADQRSRFATFSEACCSSNLLEPSSICSKTSFAVNRFCDLVRSFPQLLRHRLFL